MKLSIFYGLFASAIAVYAAPAAPGPSLMTPDNTSTGSSLTGGALDSGVSTPDGNKEDTTSTLFYITSPSDKNVKYAKGDVVDINWSNGIDEDFKIDVITGKDEKSMQLTDISFSAQGSKGFHQWTIPSSLSDGTYAFQFSFKDKKGAIVNTYSVQFEIIGKSSGGAISSSTGPSSVSPSLGKTVSGSSGNDGAMLVHSSGTSYSLPPSSNAVVDSSRKQ